MKPSYIAILAAIGLLAWLILKAVKAKPSQAVGPSATVPGGGSSDLIRATQQLPQSELPPARDIPAAPSRELVPSANQFPAFNFNGDAGQAIPSGYRR